MNISNIVNSVEKLYKKGNDFLLENYVKADNYVYALVPAAVASSYTDNVSQVNDNLNNINSGLNNIEAGLNSMQVGVNNLNETFNGLQVIFSSIMITMMGNQFISVGSSKKRNYITTIGCALVAAGCIGILTGSYLALSK